MPRRAAHCSRAPAGRLRGSTGRVLREVAATGIARDVSVGVMVLYHERCAEHRERDGRNCAPDAVTRAINGDYAACVEDGLRNGRHRVTVVPGDRLHSAYLAADEPEYRDLTPDRAVVLLTRGDIRERLLSDGHRLLIGKTLQSLLAELESQLRAPLSPEDRPTLFTELASYIHPERSVKNLNLPGFNVNEWIRPSTHLYFKNPKVIEISDKVLTESLLRSTLKYQSTQLMATGRTEYIEALLIGDHHELKDMIRSISSPGFNIPNIDLGWRGFCPDPHDFYNTNLKARLAAPNLKPYSSGYEGTESPISQKYPEYDIHLGRKWIKGIDGTGLLNDENILWLAENSNQKSGLVFGSTNRINYLDDSSDVLVVQYRLC